MLLRNSKQPGTLSDILRVASQAPRQEDSAHTAGLEGSHIHVVYPSFGEKLGTRNELRRSPLQSFLGG